MPMMNIEIKGTGGAYEDVLRRYPTIELPHDIPIRVETLDRGMRGGRPSVGIILELPAIGAVVLAQTSVKLFQMAAYAMFAKYGDMTEGAVLGTFIASTGKAELTLSNAVTCASCSHAIPGSCRFCPDCGVQTRGDQGGGEG